MIRNHVSQRTIDEVVDDIFTAAETNRSFFFPGKASFEFVSNTTEQIQLRQVKGKEASVLRVQLKKPSRQSARITADPYVAVADCER